MRPHVCRDHGAWRYGYAMNEDGNPDEWPLPPYWMWACGRCTEIYKSMKNAIREVGLAQALGVRGIDVDPTDSVVSTQVMLAQHITAEHPGEVPQPREDCRRCAADLGDRVRPSAMVLEHRCRHIFAPPAIAGRL